MDEKYHLTYVPDTFLQRTIEFLTFYGFLGFLVWLSDGSTWWTFFFGLVALLGVSIRAKQQYDKYYNRFDTKAELLAFVEALPDDTAGDSHDHG